MDDRHVVGGTGPDVVRLVERAVRPRGATLRVNPVDAGGNQIKRRVGGAGAHLQFEPQRVAAIVRIHDRDPRRRALGHGRVESPRDAQIVIVADQLDPRVRPQGKQSVDRAIRRMIVDQDKLQVGHRLIQDATRRLQQVIALVPRDHDD